MSHKLTLTSDSLVVFVDDTGHERLVPDHPVYGLGGCAIMASELERVIQQPWRQVRKIITGSADAPLHAAKFTRSATPKHIAAIAEFYRTQPFARLGAILTLETLLDDELEIVPTLCLVLQKRIVEIAKWTHFKRLDIIFESSERANHLIEQGMQNLKLEESGTPIPVECYFMPKAAGDPALEVADFIMHAVGGQAKRNLRGTRGFGKDFQAIFHSVPETLVSYIAVSKAELHS